MTDARRLIVFYGNCQADALSLIFRANPAVGSLFDVRHSPSFDDPSNTQSALNETEIRSTVVLFEQFDPKPFPYRALLPADCVTITFPSIDLNLLWPLNRDNPFNDRSDPDLPWGRFPYGDRVLIEAVERGVQLDEILAHYLTASVRELPDLDRFAKIERGRLIARDARCDVHMADFVVENFRDSPLFWCVNHPKAEALGELGRRLIAAVDGCATVLDHIDFDGTVPDQPRLDPLSLINVPVHPAVAEHFGLSWYEKMDGLYGLQGANLSYEAYFTEMARESVANRERFLRVT